MFLKRCVFIHWGNIPIGAFEFGPVNLLSGANGSGKTTAADAIQTVMTAAHENLFHFNPGQEETTQRGRGGKRVRTLASYVLGCDDGSFARPHPTDGYIAAVFHPTAGESAEPFTAVVAVRASLDTSGRQPLAREDLLAFFILTAVELDASTFLRESHGEQHVVLLDEIQEVLIRQHGRRAVERYDQKRAYLRRLYAALRGKRDAVTEREALAAARAFSRFMAYKPVSSINQFVIEEVLERKDLGEAIRSVSGQLKTIHAMERDAQSLKDSALLLEQAARQAQLYLECWTQLQVLEYTRARARHNGLQRQFLQAREQRDALSRALQDNDAQLALTAQRQVQLRRALIGLEAQRQGIPALQQKDALEAQRRRLDSRLVPAALELQAQDRRLQDNVRAAHELDTLAAAPSLIVDLPQLLGAQLRNLAQRIPDTASIAALDLTTSLQRDLTGDLQRLEQRLDLAQAAQRSHRELFDYWRHGHPDSQTRRDRVAGLDQRRRLRYEQVVGQCQQRQQDIARLEAKQSLYPASVERALTAIRAQCPQADARVLCDHIEVADARWQAGIEGYLGNARFSILVDVAYEVEAIRIVRALPGRDSVARVLQGQKALHDAALLNLPPDSIVHVLQFSHRIAQAFLIASYGKVVRVAHAEALPRIARGITADCIGSSGYSMFRCEIADAELVFGAAARERALNAKQAELLRLTQERDEANERMQESRRLLTAIDALAPLGYADSLALILELHRDISHHEMLLERLDVTEYRALDAQLEQMHQEELQLTEQRAGLNERAGEIKVQQGLINKEIARLLEHQDQAQDSVATAQQALRELHAQWPQFDLQARCSAADTEAQSFDSAAGALQRETHLQELSKAERQLDATLLQHNQKCRPADKVSYSSGSGVHDAASFQSIRDLRREIDRVYNLLRNNVLVEKHEQLQQLKQSFNNAFVSHLCQEIQHSLQEGKRQLDQLNKELVHHCFGSDRERFRFAQEWVAEYREYARFFDEVVRNPAGGDEAALFEMQLSPKSELVRDALMKLLLGADEQQSLKELERLADYRNYHRYEIYKEVDCKPPIALSEYGTGSGGQLETPAYIIRSASITAALRYAEGINHLRMVLVDEAFSKMDETRSREVIDYLTQTLGLQLIFIMPTSKCGPFMDLISNEFVFAKLPSLPRGQLNTRVLVDRRECNQSRIQELWAQHRQSIHQQAEMDFMAQWLTADAPQRTAPSR